MKLVLGVPGLNIHVTTVQLREEPGQNVTTVQLGQTVLWVQCSYGRSRNVELLLADGRIDPNQRSTDKETSPLHTAANNGRDLCVKLLLADPRVDPNLTESSGYTPLNMAAHLGRDGCVGLLL